MESLGKDQASLGSSLSPSTSFEEHAGPDIIVTRRLRDRELLKKRKAEALEKDSAQWVLGEDTRKHQRRSRRGKRGQRHPVLKAVLKSEPAADPQPGPQEKAQPVSCEPALPEPVCQQQPSMLTIPNMVSGMQGVAMGGELPSRSLDPAGEEDVLKPAEADILEELNTPLENDHEDNELDTTFLY